MNNKKLNKAKRVKDDEFYTPYEQFECWLKIFLLDKLEDKIIYCPCDAEWSNIVNVLQDYKDILKYKELIYTSDDFRTHDDLFDYCDVVITNPPFSLSREFYQILKKHNCLFFFYGHVTLMYKQFISDDIVNGYVNYINYKYLDNIFGYNCIFHQFLKDDGNKAELNYNVYTNIRGIEYKGNDIKLITKFDDVLHEYLDQTKILNIRNFMKFPIDYLGIAAVSPLSFYKWKCLFDVVCSDKKIISKYLKINGKNIYERWFVKLKGSDAKLEDYIQEEKINKLF